METAPPKGTRASAAIAFVLSFVVPGLGHVATTSVWRGALAYAVWWMSSPLLHASPLGLRPAGLAVVLGLPVLLTFGIAVDAARSARRAAARNLLVGRLLIGLAALLLTFLLGWMRTATMDATERILMLRNASESSTPTLLLGDFLIADRVRSPSIHDVSAGAFIAFEAPQEGKPIFTQRVLAVGGEAVEGRDGYVRVNGRRYPIEPHRPRRPLESPVSPTFGPVLVPDGHVFVLGEWRANSIDSRDFGPIPIESVVGIPRYVYLSFNLQTAWMRTERIGRRVR